MRMEITEAQYERIAPVLQNRGNVKLPNLPVLTDPVCRRAVQVARAAAPLRQLAYRLHTDEPVEEWGARPGV